MDLNNELNTAKELAIRAGGAIIGIYNDIFDIEYKEDESPITLADRKANEIIESGLRDRFPDYSILTEESEDDKSRLENDWCWIVDPLDGTKEFIKKNGEFTVNIALVYKQKVVLGVIYVPVTGDLYYAVKGLGSFYESKGNVEKLKVSSRNNQLRLLKGRSHVTNSLDKLLESNKDKISKVEAVGSSLKGCLIARGMADLYYRFGFTSEWDTAAMHCIVEEAGGIFRQMDNSEMIYNREKTINDKGFYVLNNINNRLIL